MDIVDRRTTGRPPRTLYAIAKDACEPTVKVSQLKMSTRTVSRSHPDSTTAKVSFTGGAPRWNDHKGSKRSSQLDLELTLAELLRRGNERTVVRMLKTGPFLIATDFESSATMLAEA